MDPELGGDGPYPPVLDEVVAQDLRLELVVERHRARRSVPGATPSASSYRRATPLPTDELADRARTEVAVHLGSAARCASSLGGRFGRHRRIGLAHRNSMTGEFSIARGASGTVMRHFVRARAFAAPAPVAPLALGMTVPAAPRVLIPASRPAQRFTPSEAAAARPAVVLAPVTARADEHLAPASGTEKQSGIVHCSPRRGGLDDPRLPGNTAFGAVRKCGSGRSLGREPPSQCSPRLRQPPRRLRSHSNSPAMSSPVRQARVSSGRQHRLRGETNDTSQADAVGRFSAGSLRPAQSVHEGCSPNNHAFSQPPTDAQCPHEMSCESRPGMEVVGGSGRGRAFSFLVTADRRARSSSRWVLALRGAIPFRRFPSPFLFLPSSRPGPRLCRLCRRRHFRCGVFDRRRHTEGLGRSASGSTASTRRSPRSAGAPAARRGCAQWGRRGRSATLSAVGPSWPRLWDVHCGVCADAARSPERPLCPLGGLGFLSAQNANAGTPEDAVGPLRDSSEPNRGIGPRLRSQLPPMRRYRRWTPVQGAPCRFPARPG